MTKKHNTIWYFPLEIIKSRYTEQLCLNWIPYAINNQIDISGKNMNIKFVNGEQDDDKQIKVGQVLDATGRGIFSLKQCSNFLKEIENGYVKDGDVLYFQDFWTPGIEAIYYALHLYKINVRVYAMVHAQSVDEYDFTYSMRSWMRGIEIGYANRMDGLFVASTIHKKQLRNAGIYTPINVVSLPIGYNEVWNRVKENDFNSENAVIFSSRLDREKNPLFMLKVAKQFLNKHKDWNWYITTSSKELRSNDDSILKKIKQYAKKNKRFIIKTNLSKDEYYKILCKCKIQFNSSLQDYVSWTLLEACICKCSLCYPNFRSFPECVPYEQLYRPWNIVSALNKLEKCIKEKIYYPFIPIVSDRGRKIEAFIIVNGIKKEINIWDNQKKVK